MAPGVTRLTVPAAIPHIATTPGVRAGMPAAVAMLAPAVQAAPEMAMASVR